PQARQLRRTSRRSDRRSGHAREAQLLGGRQPPRHRHTRPDRDGADDVTPEDRLKQAEELLGRLEQARGRLEQTKDPDEAIEILQELSEIAKNVESQLQEAKREAQS